MGKYQVGDIVSVRVTGIEDYGIFVEMNEYYSGLIHISEISDKFVRNVHDYVTMGEIIRAKILEINEEKHHIKLSIKGINYQDSKKNKSKIQETELGFSTLEEKLEEWIREKLEEID